MKEKRFAILILPGIIVFSLTLALGCGNSQSKSKDGDDYVAQVREWHKQRIERLTRKNGWLSLAGLYWLKEGKNSFGSAASNDIQFPAGKAPDFMGTFILENRETTVQIKSGIKVTNDGKPVTKMQLHSDADENPTILSYGSLSWYIIKRGEQYGVRLRDSENPHIRDFKGIDMYPIEEKWHVKATFEPFDPPKRIAVPTILGTVSQEEAPGTLIFQIDGKTCRLDPVMEEGTNQFFVIFGDKTNGSETYGAGRFVYVDQPAADGTTFIDFNKAYNPPCAFTEYATCPLPPEQNQLPIKITAGEKKYTGSHH